MTSHYETWGLVINEAMASGLPVISSLNSGAAHDLIKHNKNWITAYAHLEKIEKTKGDLVKRGQSIGVVGNTGNVKDIQLHFEIRKGKNAVNPLKHLS